MTEQLSKQRCLPCEGGAKPLDKKEAQTMGTQTPEWGLADNGKEISRTFKFKNFHETMAFVNAVAWIAHQEDHHPDMEIGYSKCHINYSTHTIGGLSANDFICAAKIDVLLA